MTLIIGLVEDGNIHFESDTLLTPKWYPPDFDPTKIDLKIQPKIRLFNEGLFAVAVAGNPDPFFALVKDHLERSWQFEDLREHLLDLHQRSNRDGEFETDFLLGCADPVGLFAFRNGLCAEVGDEAFIGDEVAYKWLLKRRAEPVGSLTPERTSERLSDDFQFALNHPEFPTVGGLSIGLRSFEGGFVFKQRMFQTMSFADDPKDIFAIDLNSFESLSFVPYDNRKKLRICFPESERCYEFEACEDGTQIPVRVI